MITFLITFGFLVVIFLLFSIFFLVKHDPVPVSYTHLDVYKRQDIIYDEGADLYNMRFYRRTFSKKTFECKTKDIAVHEGIYFDMLEEMFTMVTGLYTRF